MKRFRFVTALLCVFFATAAYSQTKAEKEIIASMRDEERVWNSGDIDGYVDFYLPDNTSKVITSKKVITGKKDILAWYKSYFTSKEKMGTLILRHDSIEKITKSVYFVSGFFHLEYTNDKPVDGRFSGLMKKVNGKWYLMTDHSS